MYNTVNIKSIKIFCNDSIIEVSPNTIKTYFLQVIINDFIYLAKVETSFNKIHIIINTLSDIYDMVDISNNITIYDYSYYKIDDLLLNQINKSFFFKLNQIDSFNSDIKKVIEYNKFLNKNGLHTLDLSHVKQPPFYDNDIKLIDYNESDITNDINNIITDNSSNKIVYIFYIRSCKKPVILVNYDLSIINLIKYEFYDLLYITTLNNVDAISLFNLENYIHLNTYENIDEINQDIEKWYYTPPINLKTRIIEFINSKFLITNIISDRIHSNKLIDIINEDLNNINTDELNKNLADYLCELGINKKRYSDGIYFYGLKIKIN